MLTDKQQKVLDTIVDFITKYGKSPTIEELRVILEQKSKRWVTQYLEALEKRWFINRSDNYRGIRLWNTIWFQTMLNIPILWYANAWTPLIFAEQTDYGALAISKKLVSWSWEDYFFLKVEWTSMNDFKVKWKTIDNWSYVLIKKDETSINSNDAFLFIVDNCATIKTPKVEWETLYLLPKSKDIVHKPIILSTYDDVKVNGKVVDVFSF